MNKKPFLSLDLPLLKKGIARVDRELSEIPGEFEEAVADAMAQWVDEVLGEAHDRAPHRDGRLRESATRIGPVVTPGSIDVKGGFNLVYARIRDQGGEIRPVRAKALFIPLRRGVRPGEPSLVWGKDFVLARRVVQKGNRYLTGVLDEKMPKAAEEIGSLAWQLFTERKGAGPTGA